jgi:hypothetical protein
VSTVLVLPSDDPVHASALGALLNGNVTAGIVRPEPGVGSPSARICSAINDLAPSPPLTLIAFGEAALSLPAVALSQRTAHRLVTDYVLVDPDLPLVTDSWPDARVAVVTDYTGSPASLQGRLRGWTVMTHEAFTRWHPDAP